MLFTYLSALGVLAFFIAAGYVVVRMPVIRRSFLPTGVGAGVLLLIFGPQVSGEFMPAMQIPDEFYKFWSKWPKQLINVVFAALFLARPMISLKKMWGLAGPQIAFGQMLAWGQYAVGGLLALVVLGPIFGMPDIIAALIEISFEGGHGTVAGMTPVFRELGFEEGRQIAVGLATTSLVTALISGIMLINWGARTGHIKRDEGLKLRRNEVYYHKVLREIRSKGVMLKQHITPWRLVTHTFLVSFGVFLGWVIHWLLLQLELATWGKNDIVIFGYLPIFTFCMFGGMIAQKVWNKLGFKTSRQIIDLISALCLGLLVATAIGTMSLEFLVKDGYIFLLLYTAGAVWILFSFLILARRMFAVHWFQNAIISMGQSMGMTATGLLFAQMVDRKNETGAVEAFGYKQLLFEPLMGGGVVTALSMPIILLIGLKAFTLVCLIITLAWMITGLLYFGKSGSKFRI